MTLREALTDVEIVFLQLEFAIKLLSFCELGKIDPSAFDSDHFVKLEDGNLHFPSGHFSDAGNLTRAASVHVSLAFGASALALDKAFEVAKITCDPESNDNICRLRALIHMVRCAYAHGIAEPRWMALGKFRRAIVVDLDGCQIRLDLQTLDGKDFEFEQIGGHRNWYRIRDVSVRVLSGLDGS